MYNDFARLKGRRVADWRASCDGFTTNLSFYLNEQPMVVNLVLRDKTGRVKDYTNSSRHCTNERKGWVWQLKHFVR